ncbi:hypothetical protein [Acetobacter pasteurianus]|uniref:hypothetical protein n=1 Tax=Acetobacter pasteurianus TaxID=438 RepID=UPI00136322DC|nr:hypothetical protein [Acetobacter pasteurianus]QHM90048.1 hypothetical protein FCN51_00155 [Acetobacter pasteurianus]
MSLLKSPEQKASACSSSFLDIIKSGLSRLAGRVVQCYNGPSLFVSNAAIDGLVNIEAMSSYFFYVKKRGGTLFRVRAEVRGDLTVFIFRKENWQQNSGPNTILTMLDSDLHLLKDRMIEADDCYRLSLRRNARKAGQEWGNTPLSQNRHYQWIYVSIDDRGDIRSYATVDFPAGRSIKVEFVSSTYLRTKYPTIHFDECAVQDGTWADVPGVYPS